jgi:hypothetical protein
MKGATPDEVKDKLKERTEKLDEICYKFLTEEDAELLPNSTMGESRGSIEIPVSPYPPVDLERKLFAYLAGSNAELDEPDPTCEVSRAKAPKTSFQCQRFVAVTSLAKRFADDLHELALSDPNWSKDRDFSSPAVLGALREPVSMFVRAGLTGVKRPVKVKSEPGPHVKSEPRGETTPGPAKRTRKR